MSIEADVNNALRSDQELIALLFNGINSIYEGYLPNAADHPAVVFATISDVPALVADDTEKARRVTMQISIVTDFGEYDAIESRVKAIMGNLGFMRANSTGLRDKESRMKIIRYVIGLEE
jgi:Protein of unknown function (DUF3168).